MNSKGFALLFTLFMTMAISLYILNDVTNALHHNRVTIRTIQHIQQRALAEAIVQKGIKTLKDHILTTGDYPGLDPDVPGSTDLRGAVGTDVGDQNYTDYLQDWYINTKHAAISTDHPTTAPWLSQLTLTSGHFYIAFKQIDQAGDDTWRDYQMSVKFSNANSGSSAEVFQTVRVSAGKLFDYSVFYEGDLEVAPGTHTTLHGPVYAKGDVYLMSASVADDLTITTNADADSEEKYALQSAGNIYFGFKRAIARNYLLDTSMSPSNPRYIANVSTTANPNAQAFDLDTSDFNRYSNDDTVEAFPGLWLQTWQNFVAGTVKDPHPPYFYYFTNDIYMDAASGHGIVIKHGGSTYTLASDFPNSPDRDYFATEEAMTGAAGQYVTTARTYYTDRSQYSSSAKMSISSAYDPSDLPKLTGDTTSDQKPVTNPNWKGLQSGGVKIVWDNSSNNGSVPTKDIPVGGSLDAHTIIEPWETGDSTSVREHKLAWQADLRVKRLSTGAIRVQVWNGGEDANGIRTYQTIAKPSFIYSSGSTMDYRFGFVVNSYVIDLAAALAYLPTQSYFSYSAGDPVVIYIGVNNGPFDSGSSKVGLVGVINATALPSGGLTFASNGRVWVWGDFNIYKKDGSACGTTALQNGTCDTPPAAIFSDSFGVLSSSWNNSSPDPDRDDRTVGSSHYLNAGIVTGHIPSQLVQAYPNCTGGGVGNLSFSNCSYGESEYAITGLKQSSRFTWTGSYWAPQKSYEEVYPTQNFSCSAGLNNATGVPNAPANTCEYWMDPSTGIYYYNNNAAGTPYANYTTKWSGMAGATDWNTWNIPIQGVKGLPFGCDSSVIPPYPYDKTILERQDTIKSAQGVTPINFCSDQIPATTGFPGLPSGWTLWQDALYNTTNYSVKTGESRTGGDETNPSVMQPSFGALQNQLEGTAYFPDHDYRPLWVPKYSGGLENLINLQENWVNKVLYLRGNIVSLWEAENLETSSGPAFYDTSYYHAPSRQYYFDTRLREAPPPRAPQVISLERKERLYA